MASRSVIFGWKGGHANLELSKDREFTQVRYRAEGDGTAEIAGIDDGHWFWRVVTPNGAKSPVWRIRRMGAGATSVRQGMLYGADFDGNGANDLVFRQAVLVDGPRLAEAFERVRRLSSDPQLPCTPLDEDDSHQGRCSGLRRGVPVGDVNGDGYDDLMAQMSSGGGGVLLWLGSASIPDPWRPAERVCPTRAGCTGGSKIVRLGDVNGDGFADVALSMSDKDCPSIGIFLGHAMGLASAPSLELSGYLEVAGGGDVDGDGLYDLVALDPKGALSLFRGRHEGVKEQPDYTLPLGVGDFLRKSDDARSPGSVPICRGEPAAQPRAVMLDLDHDGRADVAIARYVEQSVPPRLVALTGKSQAPYFTRTTPLNWPGICCPISFAWTRLPSAASNTTGLLALGSMLGTVVVPFVPGAGLGAPSTKRRGNDNSIYSDSVESVGDVNSDGFDDWFGVHTADIDGTPLYRLYLGARGGGWANRPEYRWHEGAEDVVTPSGGPAAD
jgi:hypothetical protein